MFDKRKNVFYIKVSIGLFFLIVISFYLFLFLSFQNIDVEADLSNVEVESVSENTIVEIKEIPSIELNHYGITREELIKNGDVSRFGKDITLPYK